jgi:hypothetical protein
MSQEPQSSRKSLLKIAGLVLGLAVLLWGAMNLLMARARNDATKSLSIMFPDGQVPDLSSPGFHGQITPEAATTLSHLIHSAKEPRTVSYRIGACQITGLPCMATVEVRSAGTLSTSATLYFYNGQCRHVELNH